MNRLSSNLVVGAELTANLGAGQNVLTVLVKLELGDDDVGGVDAQRDGLSRGLLANDLVDVDDVLETVDGGDLALTALVGTTDNGDLVVLADGDAADLQASKSDYILQSSSGTQKRTLYCSRSSLDRGALMMTRRWSEGALK